MIVSHLWTIARHIPDETTGRRYERIGDPYESIVLPIEFPAPRTVGP
jgi:hypothetical protein